MGATILIVDDDERLRTTVALLLRTLGHEIVEAPDVTAAESLLREREIDLVISDLRMPGGSGLDLLEIVQRLDLDAPVILLTAYGTVEGAVQAMQQGAFDYLQKPFDAEEMKLRVGRALAARRHRIESAFLRTELDQSHGFDELIGVSRKLRAVADLVRRVAPSDAAVLVTGETGTGKELIARAIHRRSARQERLLVPVNLAAIPLELLESELFGYARGAFTGAVAEREGRLGRPEGGPLSLEAAGGPPPPLQPKLRRVRQEGVVEGVGSNRRREVNVRLISATNRDLEESIRLGRFRRDLFYRIRVVEVAVPPLRERREDIPFLVTYFLRRFARAGHDAPGITEGALRLLEDYPWPGHGRELGNVIERAVVLCRGGTLGAGPPARPPPRDPPARTRAARPPP